MVTATLEAGTIIGGHYRLIEPLGEGGMGMVWSAENLAIKGSRVAVKVLHGSLVRDTVLVQRFRAEAEASARIGHPAIVKVFDFGEADDGTPWMVMEKLDGESLAAKLEREGRLAPSDAVRVVSEALEALEAAHDKGVVHRDLKPENLFLAREGSETVTKILDFGVSKFLGDDAERVRLTRTGAVLGTPAYMSPEQARGAETVDHRADLWAMGVILYELLSGALPFDGANYNALLIAIATGSPIPLSSVAPELDTGLVRVVERAMAKLPGERFASAGAMHAALRTWRDTHGSLSPKPGFSRVFVAIDRADTLVDPTNTSAQRTPRLRWPMVVAVGVLSLGVVISARSFLGGSVTPHAERTGDMPREVLLSVSGLPAGARVSVDGALVTLPVRFRGDGAHTVSVTAPGWRPWMHVVQRTTSRTVALVFAGEREQVETVEAVTDAGAVVTVSTHARSVERTRRRPRARRGDDAETHRERESVLARQPGF